MALGLLFRGERRRLAALLVPKPTIPSPSPLRPCLALNHPLPKPFPNPALTELPRQASLALGLRSRRQCANDTLSDTESSCGKEEARGGHYRGEFMEDAEGEDKRWERCARALG